MFRQTLDANGVYADAAQHGSGLTALQYRPAEGATTHDIELDISSPKRLRIEKRGETITMFLSMGSEPIQPVGSSIKLALPEPFYVGLGVCSHDVNALEKLSFQCRTEVLPPVVRKADTQRSADHRTEDNSRGQWSTRLAAASKRNWTKDLVTLQSRRRIMKVPAPGGF
jgi:hypothetical protein